MRAQGILPLFKGTFRPYVWYVVALIVLGFIGALLEGVGINAAVPLLSFLLDTESVPLDGISNTIRATFDMLGVEFTFRSLLIFIVGLFMVRATTLAVSGYIRGWISADFLYKETSDTLRRLFAASWPHLLGQKLGIVQTTLVRDIQRTGNLLMVLSQGIQSFTGALIYLLVALNISPRMTIYTLVGGAVLLLVVRPFLSRTRNTSEAVTATEKSITQFISEHTIGMKSLKAAGVEHSANMSANTLLYKLRAFHVRMSLLLSVSTSLFQPFTIIFVIVVFAVTYTLPGFNLVSFAATLYLIQKIFTYLESGQSALHSMSELIPYAESLATFKEKLATNREPRTSGDKPFSFTREITFKDVWFAYEGREPVLAGASFVIAKGTTVGLVGPSGAGKTSVADLLLRLFKPSGGHIVVDGVTIDTIDVEKWRQHIGYVAQDSFLLNDTITNNIRFYRPRLTNEEIQEAAKQANIYDFIMSLPEGFESTVGERGVLLSGGQRQRVALARALAGSPQLLVLDEATSALDAQSEILIQEAIAKLHGRVTVFIIAHRLSTLENADRILVLDRGTIVENDSPEGLRKNPASYFARHA